MIKEIFLESAGSIVKIVANNNEIDKILKDEFLIAYIPAVKILENSKKFDATIIIKKDVDNKIEINMPNVLFNYIKFNTKDLISLAEYILERLRQEKGIICIHGAGVVINNNLLVSWGTATGIGKTSLALSLAEDNNSFYSDEKILVDLKRMKVIGGISKQYISNDYWRDLLGNEKYYSRDNSFMQKSYDIGLFVQPLIAEAKEYQVDFWKSDKFFWHLYEESSRKIRGTSRMFFNNTYPIESLDTEFLAKKRIFLVKKFTKKIQAIYYKGNCNNAKKVILDIMNKNL